MGVTIRFGKKGGVDAVRMQLGSYCKHVLFPLRLVKGGNRGLVPGFKGGGRLPQCVASFGETPDTIFRARTVRQYMCRG